MTNFAVVPARLALINVDIQNVFVEGSAPDGLVVLERINRLAEVCREAGIVVFHLRHTIFNQLINLVRIQFNTLSR